MKTLRSQGRSGGFTLIELIVVIIIVGILAAIAAPKFINLSADARKATLNQLQGTVKSANLLVQAKAHMPSFITQTVAGRSDIVDVDIDGDGSLDTRLKFGYLDNTDVIKRLDIDEDALRSQEEDQDKLYIGYDLNSNNDVSDDNCYFLYTQAATINTTPQYAIEESGC